MEVSIKFFIEVLTEGSTSPTCHEIESPEASPENMPTEAYAARFYKTLSVTVFHEKESYFLSSGKIYLNASYIPVNLTLISIEDLEKKLNPSWENDLLFMRSHGLHAAYLSRSNTIHFEQEFL